MLSSAYITSSDLLLMILFCETCSFQLSRKHFDSIGFIQLHCTVTTLVLHEFPWLLLHTYTTANTTYLPLPTLYCENTCYPLSTLYCDMSPLSTLYCNTHVSHYSICRYTTTILLSMVHYDTPTFPQTTWHYETT